MFPEILSFQHEEHLIAAPGPDFLSPTPRSGASRCITVFWVFCVFCLNRVVPILVRQDFGDIEAAEEHVQFFWITSICLATSQLKCSEVIKWKVWRFLEVTCVKSKPAASFGEWGLQQAFLRVSARKSMRHNETNRKVWDFIRSGRGVRIALSSSCCGVSGCVVLFHRCWGMFPLPF